MPPALQTKSGAQRMPRSAIRASSESSASWLLAAPAIALQRSAGHRVVVEDAAERARRDQVDLGGQRRQRVGPLRVQALGQLALGLVDVGDDELGAALVQQLGQAAADAAEADHGDAAPADVLGAVQALERRPDGDLAADRGPRARVAAARRQPGDVLGPGGDDLHVGLARADVLRGQVVPAERLDRVPEVLQDGLAALRRERRLVRAQHDHALAAAERQAGDGGLERHRAREPQDVAHGRARVVVGPHPAPAQRGPAGGRVDGDHREQAGPASAPDQQRFVCERLGIVHALSLAAAVAGGGDAAGGAARAGRRDARRGAAASGAGRGGARRGAGGERGRGGVRAAWAARRPARGVRRGAGGEMAAAGGRLAPGLLSRRRAAVRRPAAGLRRRRCWAAWRAARRWSPGPGSAAAPRRPG